MTDLEKTLQKRSNISFFREDKVPDKKIIENLLENNNYSDIEKKYTVNTSELKILNEQINKLTDEHIN